MCDFQVYFYRLWFFLIAFFGRPAKAQIAQMPVPMMLPLAPLPGRIRGMFSPATIAMPRLHRQALLRHNILKPPTLISPFLPGRPLTELSRKPNAPTEMPLGIAPIPECESLRPMEPSAQRTKRRRETGRQVTLMLLMGVRRTYGEKHGGQRT